MNDNNVVCKFLKFVGWQQ